MIYAVYDRERGKYITGQEENAMEAPAEKPSAIGDPADPETHPEYEVPSSEAAQPSNPSAPAEDPAESVPSTDSDHAGQAYDPVVGRLTVGPTNQDTIDSSGDINKQVGTMGGG